MATVAPDAIINLDNMRPTPTLMPVNGMYTFNNPNNPSETIIVPEGSQYMSDGGEWIVLFNLGGIGDLNITRNPRYPLVKDKGVTQCHTI